jgi:GTP-binding protein EngB required for normal cell division
LNIVGEIIQQFGLESLLPNLRACEGLAGEGAFLDVAVLGQFKSGKSSLLNALLGSDIFPVSALPATAVITRASGGPDLVVRVRHLDGRTCEIALEQIGSFVTEAGNPKNRRQVAIVDVFTPAMAGFPGVRVVDTPGLGSVHVHNTKATLAWMPNAAVALVTVTADRPLSDEDRRLVIEARQTAPRVVVMLTKIDLLNEAERAQMAAFIDDALSESLGAAVPIMPFSIRQEPEHWVRQLRETVFRPLAEDVAAARREALNLKLTSLLRSCQGYLTVGLQAAERADADRQKLRAAVLDESVKAANIKDELLLVERRMREQVRPAFEKLLFARQDAVGRNALAALTADVPTWRGGLAAQAARFEGWMAERLAAELLPLSEASALLGAELLCEAEARLRRVVEAFRDRLGHNVREAMGVSISQATWEVKLPKLALPPVAVGRTFMMRWEMLSWLVPMGLFGWLFRRHVRGCVPWEVEKNLHRLVSEWCEAVGAALTDLRAQAARWVQAELATLDRLLGQRQPEASAFQEAMQRLDVSPAAAPSSSL